MCRVGGVRFWGAGLQGFRASGGLGVKGVGVEAERVQGGKFLVGF